jgi:hypothetical protein
MQAIVTGCLQAHVAGREILEVDDQGLAISVAVKGGPVVLIDLVELPAIFGEEDS